MFPDTLNPEIAKQIQEIQICQGAVVFGFLGLLFGFLILWKVTK